MDQNKKIIFFPGWMYSPGYFKLGGGVDIWKNKIDLKIIQSKECDYLIGHSMGAAIALKLWYADKNKNIILVNPFIEQRSILKSIIDWLKYAWHEGVYEDSRLSLKYLPKNFVRLLKFSEENYWNILKIIPKDKIKILHGEKDLFLCGKDAIVELREIGLDVIEVPEAGHNWHENFDREIKKITGVVPVKKLN